MSIAMNKGEEKINNGCIKPIGEDKTSPVNQARRYVVILPARDEERFLKHTIDCLIRQTVPPIELVIVNDGSKDATATIADAAAAAHPWIQSVHREDRGERKVGGGVVETFYTGLDTLHVQEFDYICKLDGDLTLGERYFESLMDKFDADPKLGGASGKVWNPVEDGLKEEGIIDEMVSGAANFWRRSCWEDIGGYVREVMWDGIIIHRARMNGWKTRSFRDEDLKIIHHRLMGSSHRSVYYGRMRWGRGQWFMGTHPLYILASGIFRMRERPYVIGGILIVAGYVQAWLKGKPRYDDLEFRRHLHSWQLKRLGLGWLVKQVDLYNTDERG